MRLQLQFASRDPCLGKHESVYNRFPQTSGTDQLTPGSFEKNLDVSSSDESVSVYCDDSLKNPPATVIKVLRVCMPTVSEMKFTRRHAVNGARALAHLAFKLAGL